LFSLPKLIASKILFSCFSSIVSPTSASACFLLLERNNKISSFSFFFYGFHHFHLAYYSLCLILRWFRLASYTASTVCIPSKQYLVHGPRAVRVQVIRLVYGRLRRAFSDLFYQLVSIQAGKYCLFRSVFRRSEFNFVDVSLNFQCFIFFPCVLHRRTLDSDRGTSPNFFCNNKQYCKIEVTKFRASGATEILKNLQNVCLALIAIISCLS